MKAKVTKYLLIFLLIVFTLSSIYYLKLSNRHKAIIKTTLLHKLGLVDNQWQITMTDSSASFISPTFVIDNIYKSMEGPKAYKTIQLNPNKKELVWLNSFKTTALNSNSTKRLTNDFICHSNIDYYDSEHFGKWKLNHRINEQYPRLTSISNGTESYNFPNGFGFPVFTNENLMIASQSLNHNIKDSIFSIKHKLDFGFKKHNSSFKPLKSNTIFIAIPYNLETINSDYKPLNDTNSCIPVETKNHAYIDENGNPTSGHWIVFPGKSTYKANITKQLLLKDSTTLHYAVSHLHPFAKHLKLIDKTTDSVLILSEAQSFSNKIGLKKVTDFSSEKGIMLYKNHDYELEVDIDNTSGENQDMMASMFLFLYDREMDEKIKNYKN